MKNLLIFSRDFKIYVDLLDKDKAFFSSRVKLLYAGQRPMSHDLSKTDILLGEPDLLATVISDYPNIKWVQSTWAGNNKLQEVDYSDYTLTGCKGIFGQQMLEYVLAYLLYFERNVSAYNTLKQEKVWAQLPSSGLKNKTLGIMGLGSIAQEIIAPLQMMGLNIIGLARRPKDIPNVKQYDLASLSEFASKCDYVFNLLPETEQTRGLCNAKFFKSLLPNCIFINAGRGSVIDSPQTIVDALNNKQIRAAVIDVFTQEPLPQNHPYYNCENLTITCHTAAVSAPIKVFEVFVDNLQRYLTNEPLLYTHDFVQGY